VITSIESFTTDILVVFIAPRLAFGQICAAVIGVLGQDSQIDNDVTNRLRAANEKVAIGGFLEWLRFVGDHARDQTALTVVTNAGPTRPTDRNVACLG
jgi:hypothetical protein